MSDIRVLLVDDDEDFLKVMGPRIESWGYRVTTASSGREALGLVENKGADIVILDYKMPQMDGIATLKRMRKIDRKIPVFIFTSYPDNRSIAGTEGFGINAYIPKYSIFSDAEITLKNALDMASKRL